MEERLQKLLSAAGVCSRRAAEDYLNAGRVTVNGETARLGQKADPDRDEICVDGAPLRRPEQMVYLMLNKPRGYVTTLSDEQGRPTVAELTANVGVRVYPVGRLDYDSEGLLLLTNDGDLTERMLHPSMEVDKTYLARVSNQVTPEEARQLERGVMVDGRKTARAKVHILSVQNLFTDMIITIHEGRNRQVRKMVEQIGHQVVMLRRIRFGPLKLGELPRGMWRPLTQEELDALKKL